MATSTGWMEVLTLIAESEARAANAHSADQLRWDVLDAAAHMASANAIIVGMRDQVGTPAPDPATPPTVPPDAPQAPDVEREPNIDPPPTAPPTEAPADDPRRVPPPPRTTRPRLQ